MRSLRDMPDAVVAKLRGVFFDIDDTMTSEGKLHPEPYAALWRLRAAGLRVVPVTGRPAGWCDLIVRQWPVDGVVGENGALAFMPRASGGIDELLHPAVATGDVQGRLEVVRKAILAAVPGARIAKDQPYRRFDLAVDFCEDPPDLGLDAARAMAAVFEAHGARAKISSIHVNGWFGDYDKLGMVQLFAQKLWGETAQSLREHYAFIGDSPNDGPMFGFFPHACGVANVTAFTNDAFERPAYVTTQRSGEGFVEWVCAMVGSTGAGG